MRVLAALPVAILLGATAHAEPPGGDPAPAGATAPAARPPDPPEIAGWIERQSRGAFEPTAVIRVVREIPASVERVFEICADPTTMSGWVPGVTESGWVDRRNGREGSVRFWRGVDFRLHEQVVAFEPNRRIVVVLREVDAPIGDLLADWRFERIDAGTTRVEARLKMRMSSWPLTWMGSFVERKYTGILTEGLKNLETYALTGGAPLVAGEPRPRG